VAFFGVAAGDTLADAKKYVGDTRMTMPVFADALSLMETRYGEQISLSNVHQTRVIDPTGKVVEYRFEEASIEKALDGAKWKYKDEADKKLDPAVLPLEMGRYAEGVQKLKPFLKRKDTAESAQKVYDHNIEEEKKGQTWHLREGLTAWHAAGQIHTDIQKGFVRAEVIGWDALVDAGGYSGARDKGTLRLEGRDYLMTDGDVITVKFTP